MSAYNALFEEHLGTSFSRANQGDAAAVLLADMNANYKAAVRILQHRLEMSALSSRGRHSAAAERTLEPEYCELIARCAA